MGISSLIRQLMHTFGNRKHDFPQKDPSKLNYKECTLSLGKLGSYVSLARNWICGSRKSKYFSDDAYSTKGHFKKHL